MKVQPQAYENFSRIMGEEIPEAIHFITSSATKMDDLLKGLLTLSRLERQIFSCQKLDMDRLIREVLDNLKLTNKRSKLNAMNYRHALAMNYKSTSSFLT